MRWLQENARIGARIFWFAFLGGIANTCAGAVEGLFSGFGLWIIGSFKPNVPNGFYLMFAGMAVGFWVGGLTGTGAMGLAALSQAFRPRDANWDKAFNDTYLGLLWGGVLCLMGALCGLFVLAMVWKTLPDALRDFIGQWMLHGLTGSYVLGSVVGAVAPNIPLWTLHRLGEAYGRTRLLFQGKTP